MMYENIAVVLFWSAMALNAYMDAIDHGKGKRKLRYMWHLVKWWLFIPCLFFAGYALALNPLSLSEFLVTIFIGLWIWQLTYRFFRYVFKKYGIPWWF